LPISSLRESRRLPANDLMTTAVEGGNRLPVAALGCPRQQRQFLETHRRVPLPPLPARPSRLARPDDLTGFVHHIEHPEPKPAYFASNPVRTPVLNYPAAPPFSLHTPMALSRLAPSRACARASRLVA
jgi:hypothetical protein